MNDLFQVIVSFFFFFFVCPNSQVYGKRLYYWVGKVFIKFCVERCFVSLKHHISFIHSFVFFSSFLRISLFFSLTQKIYQIFLKLTINLPLSSLPFSLSHKVYHLKKKIHLLSKKKNVEIPWIPLLFICLLGRWKKGWKEKDSKCLGCK